MFSGTKTDLEQKIGNAVPVKLAEFVAQALSKYVDDKNAGVIHENRFCENVSPFEQLTLFT